MALRNTTLSDPIADWLSQFNLLGIDVGDITTLVTDSTTSVVSAINSVKEAQLDSAEVKAIFSVVDAGGDGSFAYNSATGVSTYTGPSPTQVRAHFASGTNTTYNSTTGATSIADATIRGKVSVSSSGTGSVSYNSSTGVITYAGLTDSQIRAKFGSTTSGLGALTYNSATGSFAYAGPTNTDIRGLFAAGTNTTYNSTTGATSISDTTIRSKFVGGNGITITNGTIDFNGGIDSAQISTIRASLSSSQGISYNSSTGEFAGILATTAAKGVASFSSTNFSATTGVIAIKTDGVVTASIAGLAVTEAKVATGAVTEAKIGALAVTEAKVATGAVTEAKVATGAVTEAKVATGAVTVDKIGALAVTEAKVAAEAISSAKLKSAVGLVIYNSAGTAVKTLYGAGS